MSEIDQLVRRTVDTVTALARRASRFAGRLLLVVAIVCVGGFLLGLAALDDGIEAVWVVLAGFFGLIAVGAAFIARWRVGAIRRHVPALESEIRSLLSEGRETGHTVIETFTVDDEADGDPDGVDGFDGGSAIVLSRRLYGFRGAVGSGLESYGRLTAATTALTSFPILAFVAVMISLVFAFLGFLFLIALAL